MKQHGRGYIPLTQEQITRAQHTDIIEWLKRKGEPLKKEGKYYIWLAHDSVRIQGFKWIQNSTRESGGAVHFLEHFFGMFFPDAVLELIGERPADYMPLTYPNTPLPQAEIRKKTPAVFRLPKKNANMNRVYAYLTKTRDIDPDVVTYFTEQNTLFEDTRHNAVFVGLDKDGVARSAFKRGTITFGTGFKGEQDGSDKKYPFASRGRSSNLYVFEAAIDLMSYICLHKDRPWPQENFLAIGGLCDEGITKFLLDCPHIQNIYFCFDNDASATKKDGTPDINHGQVAAVAYCKQYSQRGYCCKIIRPKQKDWNAVLLATRQAAFEEDNP